MEQRNSGRFGAGPKLLATAIAAALSSTLPLGADAAGLGRLTVQSALGQPLRAEVEVTALGREEIGSLTARLAPPEAFRQAGLEYNPALGGLRFAIEQRPNGNAVVHVTSSQPVNEPFVDLLVELNWASGKFVREYTFLLDPPELRIGRDTRVAGGVPASAPAPAAPVARTAPASGTATAATTSPAASTASVARAPASADPRPVSVAPVAASRSSGPTASTPVSRPAAATAESVRVEAGDTLAKIAARVKPADVSVEQAIMAIYRANPRAFFGTVHQLFAGAELKIPEVAAMKSIDAAEARREIRAQAADFNAYRGRLASSARSVQPTKAGQTAEGSVAAKPEESSAPVASGDQLNCRDRVPQEAAGGSATGGAGAASSQSSAEMQVARDAALREQQERVSALERNVADLQQLVELKNRQLAELQRQVEAARTAGAAVSGTIASAASGATSAPSVPAPVDSSATAPAAGAAATAAGKTESAAPAAAASGPAAPAPSAGGEVAPVESAPAEPADSAPNDKLSETAAQGEPAAPPPASAPVSPPAPEPSVLESLTANPLVLPALVAIALGLGGYGVYAARRRRKDEGLDDSLGSADAFTANSLFGSTGGQSVDTHASLFATGERDSGVDVHSTEVDPIAEAEVYIAYGREAQAEEILKEALKRQPERQAIRLKLLEIHAARKDPIAFGALAQEMFDQTGGLNEEWAKVVTLGLSIDPANPLYTGQDATAFTAQPADESEGASAIADEPLAISDLGVEADAAAAMFGEPGFDPAAPQRRGPDKPFAETVPMDGEDAASGRAASDHEVPALDFHLDLDEPGAPAAGVHASGEAEDEPTSASALEHAIDGRFELPSLDLDDASSSDQARAARAREPQGADEEPAALADLGEFKIDLPSLEGIDASSIDGSDDERPAIDPADLDSDAPLGSLDFSSIDLELSHGDVGLAAADTAVTSPVASSRWQEMATKLDLASAYEEIGDKEGARELLQEVLDGGDASQQQKARAMLAKIG
ncbi:MAG: hypothetical protein M9885_06045 [Burkholderiaceae bacterium]|nr:hypothetical protein [Burkholderiaceae bacterium]